MLKKGNNILNNSQYQIISIEEEVQNDKERIRRKFNFTGTRNTSLNSSNVSEIQSKISDSIKKKNIENNNNKNNEQIIIENEISDKSSNTDIIDEPLGNNETLNKNFNEEEYYNVDNSSRIDEFDFNENRKKNHNPISDDGNSNLSKIMKRNGSSPFLKNHNKFKKFLVDAHFNVSSLGLLDDEHVIIRNQQDNFSKFKFIHEVQLNNLSYENIPLKKFLALNNKSTFIIFSFLYDEYNNLMKIGKKLKTIFELTLKKKFSYIIENFKNKYKEILLFEKFKFIQTSAIKLKKKTNAIFSIYIKCKIKETPFLQKYEGISYEISYSFKNSQNKKKENFFYQIYKFDIRKNKYYPIWICSEMDEKHYSQRRLVYSSPVQNYSERDHIIIKIDLIEGNNFISDIQFFNYKILASPKHLYEKGFYRNGIGYDGMRDCEIENMILRWNNENNLIKNSEMLFYIKRTFGKFFTLIEVKYDISKIVFYKIKMKAEKIGLIKKNRIFNLNLEILDEEAEITNECIYIGCINTYTQNKILQIRKGTIIILYITDLKN